MAAQKPLVTTVIFSNRITDSRYVVSPVSRPEVQMIDEKKTEFGDVLASPTRPTTNSIIYQSIRICLSCL